MKLCASAENELFLKAGIAIAAGTGCGMIERGVPLRL
jgi:hypothetical protein